jgi:hypothetical protein
MEEPLVKFYEILKDLGAELAMVPDGGHPDWRQVKDKAKELQTLAESVLSAEKPAGG